MATYLTDDALEHLKDNAGLQAEICPFVGIRIDSIIPAIRRNSKSLTSYHAVLLIAASMGKQPTDIIHELPN